MAKHLQSRVGRFFSWFRVGPILFTAGLGTLLWLVANRGPAVLGWLLLGCLALAVVAVSLKVAAGVVDIVRGPR